MSNLSRMLAAFQNCGHLPQNFISKATFLTTLDQLLGRHFDRQVGEELWEQADVNKNYEADVRQLCEIIEDAQKIMKDKYLSTLQKINRLKGRLNEIPLDGRLNAQQRTLQRQQIERELRQLDRDSIQFGQDLQFLTQPFGIPFDNLRGFISQQTLSVMSPENNPVSFMPFPQKNSNSPTTTMFNSPLPLPTTNNNILGNSSIDKNVGLMGLKAIRLDEPVPKAGQNVDLMYVFWISIIMGLLEMVQMFRRPNFLNVRIDLMKLLTCLCVLSIFILNYFDRVYVRVCMLLTGLCLLTDLIWIVFFSGSYWDPPKVSMFANSQQDYLRLIVIFAFLTLLLKIPLLLLLYKHREITQQSNYFIEMGRLHVFNKQRNAVSDIVNMDLQKLGLQ